MIPVVLNGADMSQVAPPHSYINVMDFNTTEELASYLNKVDQDDELFASYFWWRDYYTVKVEINLININRDNQEIITTFTRENSQKYKPGAIYARIFIKETEYREL